MTSQLFIWDFTILSDTQFSETQGTFILHYLLTPHLLQEEEQYNISHDSAKASKINLLIICQ